MTSLYRTMYIFGFDILVLRITNVLIVFFVFFL